MTNLKLAVKALKKIKSKPKTNLMTATEACMNLKNKPEYIMDLANSNSFEINLSSGFGTVTRNNWYDSGPTIGA
jgi:hypothetical protein